MQTATLRIEKSDAEKQRTCGMKTAEGDTVEFEFEASVQATGGVFDSSAQRSGRERAASPRATPTRRSLVATARRAVRSASGER